MLPKNGAAAESSEGCEGGRGQLTRVEAIHHSMTNQERRDHNVIDGKRGSASPGGSGTTVQDVKTVLKQYPANADDDGSSTKHGRARQVEGLGNCPGFVSGE